MTKPGTTVLFCALSVGLWAGGCDDDGPSFTTNADSGTDGDADGDSDSDSDADADADADGDGDTEVECEGSGWLDPATNSCWQDPPPDNYLNWDNAMSYCNNLQHGGYGDWRLPSISELRSLIRGCQATETGGACAVKDSCLALECWSASCDGCTDSEGPGTEGCYWDPGLLGGANCGWYWSSSTYAGGSTDAWLVVFSQGKVGRHIKTNTQSVRCVRGGA
jgi:hypothetical protein